MPLYLEQRTSIIKASLKRYEGSPPSSSSSSSQSNHHSSSKAGGSSTLGSGGKSSPSALLELIKQGDVLYTKGNMFFPRYMEVILAILRGETMLFNKVLPNSNHASEKVFCAVCLCVIEELRATIAPFVGEGSLENLIGSGASSGKGAGAGGLMGASFAAKKMTDKSVETKPVILQRKSNLFLIHLDILDIFLANFFDLR